MNQSRLHFILGTYEKLHLETLGHQVITFLEGEETRAYNAAKLRLNAIFGGVTSQLDLELLEYETVGNFGEPDLKLIYTYRLHAYENASKIMNANSRVEGATFKVTNTLKEVKVETLKDGEEMSPREIARTVDRSLQGR